MIPLCLGMCLHFVHWSSFLCTVYLSFRDSANQEGAQKNNNNFKKQLQKLYIALYLKKNQHILKT